ncbi:hypothetical protein K440DRAFT_318568 [Wilcoxina mikolae CBS 423.85]|nr:hypothetical protein K440DRAFT_318568 [Wilcoxina mikolae CBS 423.85]
MASTQATTTTNTSPTTTTDRFSDPFAASREEDSDMFATTRRASDSSTTSDTDRVPLSQRDRRLSKEWDAAQTPPSKFQRLPGSIYATPASRDGHVARNKIHGFKEKVKELSGGKK